MDTLAQAIDAEQAKAEQAYIDLVIELGEAGDPAKLAGDKNRLLTIPPLSGRTPENLKLDVARVETRKSDVASLDEADELDRKAKEAHAEWQRANTAYCKGVPRIEQQEWKDKISRLKGESSNFTRRADALRRNAQQSLIRSARCNIAGEVVGHWSDWRNFQPTTNAERDHYSECVRNAPPGALIPSAIYTDP